MSMITLARLLKEERPFQPEEQARRHRGFLLSQDREEMIEAFGLVLSAPRHVYHPRSGSSSDFVLRHIPRFSRESVLDVGTGTGVLGIYLAKLGNLVTATDISASALQTARDNASRNGVRVTFILSDLFRRLSRWARFDRILFNLPFYQKSMDVPDDRMLCDPEGRLLCRFLKGLRSHLRPRGRAYLTYSNLGSFGLLRALLDNYRLRGRVLSQTRNDEVGVEVYLLELRCAPP